MHEEDTLKKRWGILESRKGSLHTRNEKYARWTLPYLYADVNDKQEELDTDLNSTGARAVNHLSNKKIEVLYPSYRPFLKLELSDDVQAELKEAQVPMADVTEGLAKGERKVIRALDKMGHRTAATLAAKYLIVTGNALVYYPEGKAQVYNTRDYCIVRDLSGTVIELITRDMKAFETFSKDVQTKLVADGKGSGEKDYKSGTDVTIYTQIKLNDNKYEVTQAADTVALEVNENRYAKKDLPWIPLTWNLVRGEDYGRGLVEDYRGAFNAVDVLTQSLVEGVIGAAALKFLVHPSSVVDVQELNDSPNGSYHAGREGDITTVKSDKHLDFQQVRQVKEDFERQIAQGFLMGSEVTRDAERVTAEEIRKDVQELEIAFGGIYSRFTEDWQEPVAGIMLSRQDVQVGDDSIYPVIVTGLDTLSRMGDLDNYRMFANDLAAINELPEIVQQYLKVGELITWVGTNRGLDYTQFVKTDGELQAEQAEAQAAQQAQMQAETGNQMVADAGKAIAQQEL